MSTYYHDLKDPWGNIAVEETPEHYRITLWDNQGSQVGALTLQVLDGHEAIHHFFQDTPVCQAYFDGRGRVLRKFREARTATLLSDYGDIVNADEVRKECYRWHDLEPEPPLDDLA